MTTEKAYDLVIFGATGYTGRQVTRAVVHRALLRPLRWAVAGRDASRLEALVAEMVPPAVPRPGIVVADKFDLGSLQALAAQATVVLNLAGPYAGGGEAVVQACIAHGTHHLDLSGETFWMRQLVERHHRAAERMGARVVLACGYEALPFDIATAWAAHSLRELTGEPCREVKVIVSFHGRPVAGLHGAVSAGTLATLRNLLEFDTTDSVRNPACLLPADEAPSVRRVTAARNAYRFLPHVDADAKVVTAPALPAPFVTPPVVLRSVALTRDETLYAPDFRYAEAIDVTSLVPQHALLPDAVARAGQWAAAAAIAAPLAGLMATVNGPLRFQRRALRELLDWAAPHVASGPDEERLAASGCRFEVTAVSSGGKRWRGRVEAQGHPGYRSAPEMAATVAIGLARGDYANSGRPGVVTPATAFGLAAVPALAEAGLSFLPLG